MLSFIDLIKSLYHKQLSVFVHKTLKLIRKFPIPSIFLIIMGFFTGSYLTTLTHEAKNEALGARYVLCKEQLQTSKEQYEENIKIKESTIQLYTLLSSNNRGNTDLPHYDPKGKNRLASNDEITKETPKPDNEAVPIISSSETEETGANKNEGSPLSKQEEKEAPQKDDVSRTNIGAPRCSAQPITAQELASCLLLTANTYHIPAAVLVGIMHVEGGRVGEETRNKDGSFSLGPYKINSKIIPELAEAWKIKPDAAKVMVRDNGCINARVTAWQLAKKMDQADNIFNAIALYHSASKKEGEIFASKVVSAMMEKGLIRSSGSKASSWHNGSTETITDDEGSNPTPTTGDGSFHDFVKFMIGG